MMLSLRAAKQSASIEKTHEREAVGVRVPDRVAVLDLVPVRLLVFECVAVLVGVSDCVAVRVTLDVPDDVHDDVVVALIVSVAVCDKDSDGVGEKMPLGVLDRVELRDALRDRVPLRVAVAEADEDCDGESDALPELLPESDADGDDDAVGAAVPDGVAVRDRVSADVPDCVEAAVYVLVIERVTVPDTDAGDNESDGEGVVVAVIVNEGVALAVDEYDDDAVAEKVGSGNANGCRKSVFAPAVAIVVHDFVESS